MLSINELSVSPEKFASEVYRELPDKAKSGSLMVGDINRRFISGLIRQCQPKNILEIGVAYGGGTSVILNAIRDMPETKLVSVDRMPEFGFFYDNSKIAEPKPIGYIAKELYADAYESGKAKLFTGVDTSEIIENFDEKFDFVVLDTAHFHPIETLNFISIFPFLAKDAIVVLDDLMLHFAASELYATRLLFDSVVADKITVDDDNIISHNVAAFQLNADTPKYIDDVFRALLMPWSMYTEDVFSIRKIVEKYYTKKQLKIFDSATKYNENYLAVLRLGTPRPKDVDLFNRVYNQSKEYAVKQFREKVKTALSPFSGKAIYLYCAGLCTNDIITMFNNAGLSEFLPKAIFDRNFENIEPISGIPVIKPDFSKLSDGDLIIVALYDETEAESIVKIVKAVGFSNICTVQSLGLPINFI
ncbi:MAG: class I SAM-dependent methyltransferase [Ruminococcus sp.]|jgi:predicted O-methyltransferase YrrM|nr:class I SAM-dependent methyltransferase [Ruminococcus sp.]